MGIEVSKKSLERKRIEFEDIVMKTLKLFKEEGIPLNFKGYKETLRDYANLSESDLTSIEIIRREVNLWIDYFGDLESLVQSVYLKYMNKKLYLKAFTITPKTEQLLKELDINLQLIKMLHKHLKIQKSMFNRIYYHCNKMFDEACEFYTYRNNY